MLQLVNALDSKNPKYLRQLKRLFKQAFPRFERKPWWLLQRTAAAGQAELLAVCDSNQPGRFCGLTICLFWQDLVLLDYFAVCPQQRNQGLGRQILPLLRQRYAGRRLLLETERPGSPHTNYADCCRRLRFYAACGLQNTGRVPVRQRISAALGAVPTAALAARTNAANAHFCGILWALQRPVWRTHRLAAEYQRN